MKNPADFSSSHGLVCYYLRLFHLESELNQRTTLIPEIFTLNFPGHLHPSAATFSPETAASAYLQS